LFSILSNEIFKELHLNFYKLLCSLEVDESILKEIENKIYEIIAEEQSIHYLCYTLGVAISELSKHLQFYTEFWKNNGVQIVLQRISQIIPANTTLPDLDTLMMTSILPGFTRILNMYVSELLW
jgi:hypothetical protein